MRGSNVQALGPNILYSRLRTAPKKVISNPVKAVQKIEISFDEAAISVLEKALSLSNMPKYSNLYSQFFRHLKDDTLAKEYARELGQLIEEITPSLGGRYQGMYFDQDKQKRREILESTLGILKTK